MRSITQNVPLGRRTGERIKVVLVRTREGNSNAVPRSEQVGNRHQVDLYLCRLAGNEWPGVGPAKAVPRSRRDVRERTLRHGAIQRPQQALVT
jgi:hypothetical protein